MGQHDYTARVIWTGNKGQGTANYKAYNRSWNIETPGKPLIECSNDPLLGGNPNLHNPEDILIAALSACHMLWFLHLASNAGIVVRAYRDDPLAVGATDAAGASRFLHATLRPEIVVNMGTDLERADALHPQVSKYCFIARSVNFPVSYEAHYQTQG